MDTTLWRPVYDDWNKIYEILVEFNHFDILLFDLFEIYDIFKI